MPTLDRAKAIRLALQCNDELIAEAVAEGVLTPVAAERRRASDTDRIVALVDKAIADYELRQATGGYH